MIGQRVSDARLAAGLSQGGLARAMRDRGCRWYQSTVSKVESGTRPLWLAEAVVLGRLLHTTPTDLAA